MQEAGVDFGGGGVEGAQEDAGERGGGRVGAEGSDRDFGGEVLGVAVDAGADGGEGDGLAVVLGGQFQAAAVAACQLGGFSLVAAVPDRADGVEDELGGETEAEGRFGVAGVASVELAAGFQELWTGGAVDCSVDASASAQGVIGGVDDGVDGEAGDVSVMDFQVHLCMT